MPEERIPSTLTGVYVDTIRVEAPPYDNPDALQEFVGFGATSEYFLQPITSVTEGRISEFVDTWSDKLTGDRYRLVYTLFVRARHERGARVKARSYIRAQNPFEPSVINIKSESEISDHLDILSSSSPISEFYEVRAEVSK